VFVTLSRREGRGDGGRRELQKKELFVQALSVRTEVVVKRVAVCCQMTLSTVGKETYRDCHWHCA